MRILFAGGGTGGHLYPALAVAQHLRGVDPHLECLFLGTERGLEREIVPRAGFDLHTIPGSGFRRVGLPGRLRFFWSLARGLVSALALLRRWRPDVVVATGGYASLAGGLAAVLLRRPLVVQEQNRIPGFANRLLGRWARRVYVAFPDTEAFFEDPSRVRVTGNPLRSEILHARERSAEPAYDSPVVLVVGGSRGARSINDAVSQAIPLVAAHLRVHWLWQTGGGDHARVAARWAGDPHVRLHAYLHDMAAAYASASLVVCRSGAMTVSEITALGRPAILVPFPGAVDDHQTANAHYVVGAGAGILVPDAELSGERLAREIRTLLERPGRLEEMSGCSAALARPRAAADIAEDLGLCVRAGTSGVAYVRAG
ncbi:MAG: undecaprenyldiphospho-muramoylpentapeptide beta-N-acetylglucosaminyltransferase [Candidatus Krumholzibacteriia bacterium]